MIASLEFPFAKLVVSASSADPELLAKSLVADRVKAAPSVPVGMSVDSFAVFVFRLAPVTNLFEFRLTVEPCPTSKSIDPERGESLAAISVVVGRGLMMVGTEDGETLESRIEWLPPYAAGDDLVTCTRRGLLFDVAEVPAGHVFDFHLAIAYNRANLEDSSEWFAVDVRHHDLKRAKRIGRLRWI